MNESMPGSNHNPKDLALAVFSELVKQGEPCPKLGVLTELFETMFFVSLKTEESSPISFDMVYLDPSNADPEPPGRLPNDRWMVIQLSQSIEVSISNLAKIAKASDRQTSSLAIYHDENERLLVWGFIDQGNTYSEYVNHESETEVARPGLFHASILGVGHLVAFVKMKKVAELNVNSLITTVSDVLQDGPIRTALSSGIQSYLEAVTIAVPTEKNKDPSQWTTRLVSDWLKTLCRLLLRIQRLGHGGAILITPDNSANFLNLKYEMPYDRLRSSLEDHGVLFIESKYLETNIWEDHINKNANEIPVDLYLARSKARRDMEENRRELEGTISFISSVSRVDGLVLLNPNLELQGFGVEIVSIDEPVTVSVASGPEAIESELQRMDFNHYGTRHRSMMRYCAKVLGSIGFVVSQDGDVRAMTRVREEVVMWENIKLQLPEYVTVLENPIQES
jgi:hypothetical protein